MATTIDISDITSNVSIVSGSVTGDGYFDDLMETATKHLQLQYDNGYITGDYYARAYTNILNNIMNQSVMFALDKGIKESQADKIKKEIEISEINREVANSTKQDKIDVSGYKRDTELVSKNIAENTQTYKENLAEYQADKVNYEALYTKEQRTQLIQSVKDNRKIKALDTLGDTYGTFGAGGISPDDAMWESYYNIVTELVSELQDYIDAVSSSAEVSAITNQKDGDYVVCDTTFTHEGVEYVDGDVLVYSCHETDDNGNCTQGRWKKSIAYLPSSTTVSVVESSSS